jgi:hypothetical protein
MDLIENIKFERVCNGIIVPQDCKSSGAGEALKTDVETLLNFDSKRHVIHIENNQGSIYTSINYGTVNTLDKDLIKILTNLNEEVMRLNRKLLEGK